MSAVQISGTWRWTVTVTPLGARNTEVTWWEMEPLPYSSRSRSSSRAEKKGSV